VLMAEIQGMSDDALMEVVRYIRLLKGTKSEGSTAVIGSGKPIIRKAGKYRGQIVVADDFDEPLEMFKEYM